MTRYADGPTTEADIIIHAPIGYVWRLVSDITTPSDSPRSSKASNGSTTVVQQWAPASGDQYPCQSRPVGVHQRGHALRT